MRGVRRFTEMEGNILLDVWLNLRLVAYLNGILDVIIFLSLNKEAKAYIKENIL